MRRTVSVSILAFLLVSTGMTAFHVPSARATGTIYIEPDGSIYPPTANITTTDNVTYILTRNIFDCILVFRDHIVIDGAGYTLQGTGEDGSKGIELSERTNVTVRNTQIKNFFHGISLFSSSSNTIIENNITNNDIGVNFYRCSNSSISGNNITDNRDCGIVLGDHSSYNIINGNNVTANISSGIELWTSCDYNNISGNAIANNNCGIVLSYSSSSDNSISGNNVTANINYGILLEYSLNTNVSDNNVTEHRNFGIMLGYGSSGDRVSENNITDNYYGIQLGYGSSNISVSGNSITANNRGIVLFSSSNNNSMCGNNIMANNQSGIWLYSSSNCSVSGNNIANNEYGISLDYSSNSSIFGNSITNNDYGIGLNYSSTYNGLSGNTITANGFGIYLDDSSDYNSIVENSLAYNGYGVWLYSSSNYNVVSGNTFTNGGLTVWDSYQNVVESNTINGKPLVYLEGVTNYTVSDAGQVILVNCTDIKVENLNLSRTSIGVQLWQTSNSSIADNTLAYNGYGVLLCYSSNNSVIGNTVTANIWHGISLAFSSSNSFSGNDIADNYYGVWLDYSSNNRFYLNHFIGNSQQVNVSSLYANVWDDGYPCGGNFWSDYNGTDLFSGLDQNETGRDAIGDAEYFIEGNNSDDYPLMGMFSDYNATLTQHVTTICNSTISDFQFNGTAIMFNVTGDEETAGFCRICVPTSLMNVTYRVFVNGTEVSNNLLLCSNSTHSYIYFNYTHSTQEVIVTIPELTSALILPLFMTATFLAVVVCKRRCARYLQKKEGGLRELKEKWRNPHAR